MVEYCILPLGFEGITETAPRVASVLLYGPQGCGKTMLVKAIATEAGANLFNISPSNTANEYKGKANVTKMIHMVFKVAKLKAPSVIFLGNAEMVFAKKVPKDDTTDPKRIRKDLLKAVKGIKPSDRVLLVGTSDKPWDADLKAMVPCFDKMICVPKPDYAARQMLWGVGILRNLPHPQSLRNVHTSLLARYSEGITTAGIFR
ncbi:MAG: P-loop containing nucleoside triphosphate hydrolase protein, partial [Olpidium bornovanus]